MINNLLTSLARSVRKSICLRVFCSDITRSSFGLYENFRQILFSTLTSCYPFCYCFSHLIFCHIIFFSRIYINSLDFLFIQCFSLTKDQRSKRQTLLCRSTLTFLYFNVYLNTGYAAHYILCFSLTKGLRSKRQTSLSISAVHQPFYISI